MPRDNGTQTRTFAYTGSDLTSATNPENGTEYPTGRITRTNDTMGSAWTVRDAGSVSGECGARGI
jgi:hypothetical protein